MGTKSKTTCSDKPGDVEKAAAPAISRVLLYLIGVTVGQISVDGGTIADFCRTLEDGLDRPVIDETNLTGRYDFQVARADSTREQFFQQLHDQFGLIVTPSQRNVTLLAVRPI